MRLNNRIALVTGGGSGIGQGICELFAAEGASIAVVDIDLARAEQVAALICGRGGSAGAFAADVADADAVRAVVDAVTQDLGAIDVLVNNAALSEGDDIRQIPIEALDRQIGVILRGAFLLTRHLLPGMVTMHRGCIVNIGSVNGLGGLGEEAYSAAKAALINLAQNLAVKHGRDGIRANVICPGTVRTPIWNDVLQRDPNVFERLQTWYPLGRIGEVSDVANAALFLASDDTSWITGVTLPVDGGLMAGNYRMSRQLLGE